MTMIPRPIFSFTFVFSLLTFCLENYTDFSKRTQLPSDAKTEAITKIRTLLTSITDQVDIQDAAFNLVKEDNKGIQITGIASLFGIQNIQIRATVGNTLTEINTTFPSGASNQIRISGQNISDWLPDFMRNRLDLTEMQMQFFTAEGNRLTLRATLAQPSANSLIDYNGFKIQSPTLVFSLARSGGEAPNTNVSAALTGILQLGDLNFDLSASANANREWAFSGSLNELKITNFIRNAGSYLGLNMPAMPEPIENFSIRQVSLSVNSDRSVKVKGSSDFGKMEAFFAKQTGKPTSFLLGFSPNTDYKLARISDALAPIDKLGLTDIAMVYADRKSVV